jgi:hypothetical protein
MTGRPPTALSLPHHPVAFTGKNTRGHAFTL